MKDAIVETTKIKNNPSSYRDIYQEVTDKIIAQLEKEIFPGDSKAA